MDQTNRFAPPKAVVEDVATSSGDAALASRRDRFSAAFIDSVPSPVAAPRLLPRCLLDSPLIFRSSRKGLHDSIAVKA